MPQDLFAQAGIDPTQDTSQPRDLFADNGIKVSAPVQQAPAGFLDASHAGMQRLANVGNSIVNAINNFGGGVAAGLSPFPSQNNPQANQPFYDPNSAAGMIGKFGANIAPVMAGTGAVDSAAGLLPKLTGVAAKLSGYGGLGAAMTPNDPAMGAIGGAAGVPGGALVGKGLQILSSLNPDEYATQVYKALTGGKGASENSNEIANQLSANLNAQCSAHSDQYNSIFDQANQLGLNNVQPTNFVSALKSNSEFLQKAPKDLQTKINSFDPKLQNAHNLQSELRYYGYKYSNSSDPNTQDLGNALNDVRSGLQSDILNTLQPAGLDKPYQAVTASYRNNVVPYFAFDDLATGTAPQLKSILSKFAFPNANPTVSGPLTVANHGGDQFKNLLIAHAVKSAVPTSGDISGQALYKAYQGIDSQGLKSYLTPDANQMFQTLGQKLSNQPISGESGGIVGKVLNVSPVLTNAFLKVAANPVQNVAQRISPTLVTKGSIAGLLSGANQ
jgi:hypothetical protein